MLPPEVSALEPSVRLTISTPVTVALVSQPAVTSDRQGWPGMAGDRQGWPRVARDDAADGHRRRGPTSPVSLGAVDDLGRSGWRREDPALVTGRGRFVADVDDPSLADALHVVFVRSPVASGNIVSIDLGAARAAYGVVGVVSAGDLDIGHLPPVLAIFDPRFSVPPLATDAVRYVGEAVAAVVAATSATAEDAAERVIVDIAALPVPVPGDADVMRVLTVGEAAPAGSPELFDGCDVVVEVATNRPRIAPCPIECRGSASVVVDGRLHHWTSTQAPHGVKRTLQAVFGLDDDAVRVVAPEVGGAFGSKFGACPEEIVAAWLARRLGRAVRWTESRQESMLSLHHGRAQSQVARLGGDRAGRLAAYSLTVHQDGGAYADLGAYAPDATLRMTTGVYDIPCAVASSTSVRTSTVPVGAYRGTGRPEATGALERAVDVFANEIGMDPVELRRRNLVGAASFPYTSAVGTVYDTGDYRRALDAAVEAADYTGLRVEQQRRRSNPVDRLQLGIGVAVYVESTAAGPGMEFATVGIRVDGRAEVRSGSSPHGQGHHSTWALIAARVLGLDPATISVVTGDTDLVPAGLGTFASRSVQIAGSAVWSASAAVLERGRLLAAQLFEAAVDDVVLDPTRHGFTVRGTPARFLGWAAVAAAPAASAASAESDPRSLGGTPAGMIAETRMFNGAMTFPFGAHVVVVEVDTETGEVRVRRVIAADDAGRVLHPALFEGQVHGGIAQGIGEMLFEEFVYSSDGTPLTTTLADYLVPSAAELPLFELVRSETPTPGNPLGAKGIGESGTIGAAAAVHNAVCDAVAHLGVRHLEPPLSPERIWRAIRSSSSVGPVR